MGFKFTDILIKDHDHRKTLNYFYNGSFKELFEYKIDAIQWEQKSFPMAKALGIDKYEICTWEDKEAGYKNQMIFESNKKIPWLRIACRDVSLYEPDLTHKLLEINPNALIGNFSYISTSDSAFISINSDEKPTYIAWNCDKHEIEWLNYEANSRKGQFLLPQELGPCGEELIVYYWQKIFPEIPLRYDLNLPSEDLINLLKENINI